MVNPVLHFTAVVCNKDADKFVQEEAVAGPSGNSEILINQDRRMVIHSIV